MPDQLDSTGRRRESEVGWSRDTAVARPVTLGTHAAFCEVTSVTYPRGAVGTVPKAPGPARGP